MNITNPIPTQFPSTYELLLSSTPQTLFVIKIVISNPIVSQTITFYNQNGSIEGEPITFKSSLEIKLRYVNYSKITFSDSNSYSIFASMQTLIFSTEENMSLYQSDGDLTIAPINNAQIIKPLDSNGYIETDDVGLNGKIAKLNQDANGNQGVNLENPIPAGSNAIGSVGVTSLPALPTGTNAIGSVEVTSIPPIPAGTNSIGAVGLNAGSNSIGNVGVNPYALTNASLTGTTDATVNTKAQFTTSTILARHFEFVNTGTATILIGDSANQPIPIASGGVFIFDGNEETTNLNQWYTISATASVAYAMVYQS